mmetsp:Transcript_36158/g.62349  ORF Transcript_36158/g.62349 Transcript_36158/m.62349 type:complete len:252 (+) Transcript_36158:445-1200(+)
MVKRTQHRVGFFLLQEASPAQHRAEHRLHLGGSFVHILQMLLHFHVLHPHIKVREAEETSQAHFQFAFVCDKAHPRFELEIHQSAFGSRAHDSRLIDSLVRYFLHILFPSVEVLSNEGTEIVVQSVFDGSAEVVVMQPRMPAVDIIGLLADLEPQIDNRMVFLVTKASSIVLLNHPRGPKTPQFRHGPVSIPQHLQFDCSTRRRNEVSSSWPWVFVELALTIRTVAGGEDIIPFIILLSDLCFNILSSEER